MKKTVIGALSIVALGCGMLTVSPAWLAQPQQCRLVAYPPALQGSEVDGTGGRQGCGTSGVVLTSLMHQRIIWDSELAFRSGTVTNVMWTATADCLSGSNDYYTETNGPGGTSVTTPTLNYVCS